MSMPMRPQPDRPLTLRERLGPPAIWFAFLAGPLIWAAHFLLMYGGVTLACESDLNWTLYLPTIIAVPAVIAALVVSWRLWQKAPNPDERHAALQTRTRTRFFGWAGLFMNAVFLLAILFEGAAPLMLDACGPL